MDEADLAQVRVEGERDAGVAKVQADIAGAGLEHCEDCGDRIEKARRAAMPSARRCHGCEELRERVRRMFGVRK